MQDKGRNSDMPLWMAICIFVTVVVIVAFPLFLLLCAIIVLAKSKGWIALAVRLCGVGLAVGIAVYFSGQIFQAYNSLSRFGLNEVFRSYFPWDYVSEVGKVWGIVNGVGFVSIWGTYFISGGSFGEARNAFAWGGNRKPRKETTEGMQLEDLTKTKVAKHWAKPGKNPRPVSLGLVSFPSVKTETLHTVIEGATGSGKTQALKTLVATALERGDSVIAIDGGADLYKTFKDQVNDVSRFDLMDGHDLGWWPLNEIERRADWKQLAQGFLGEGKGDSAEWIGMAKTLFADTMAGYSEACIEEDVTFSMENAFDLLTIAPPEALEPYVEGTAAAAIVGNSKGTGAIRMSFLNSLAFFQYLPKNRGTFSVRDWTRSAMETNQQKALFVTYRERDLATAKNLLSFVAEMVISTAIDQGESDKKIWLIVDELAGLGEIPSLLNGAAKLRKTGMRLTVGIQDYDQIEDLYGRSRAASITNNLSNKMVLRSTSPQSAERLAKTLGDHKITMLTESKGTSSRALELASHNRTTNMSEKIENVVMPATIQGLPDLRAYVKMAGESKITKTKVPVYGGTPQEMSDDAKQLIKKGEPVFVARHRRK